MEDFDYLSKICIPIGGVEKYASVEEFEKLNDSELVMVLPETVNFGTPDIMIDVCSLMLEFIDAEQLFDALKGVISFFEEKTENFADEQKPKLSLNIYNPERTMNLVVAISPNENGYDDSLKKIQGVIALFKTNCIQ